MTSQQQEAEDAQRGEFCRVHIRVLCRSRHGQSVGVTGLQSLSSANTVSTSTAGAVGGEDSGAHSGVAIKLVTTPEAYPIWYTAAPLVLSRGAAAQYKYCLIEAGNVKIMEKRVAPREIVPQGVEEVVEDEFSLSGLGEGPRLFRDLHAIAALEDESERETERETDRERETEREPAVRPPLPPQGSPRASPRLAASRAKERERDTSLVKWSLDTRMRAEREKEKEREREREKEKEKERAREEDKQREELESETEREKEREREREPGTEFLRYAIERQSRLLLICYHLPVTVTRTGREIDPLEVSWAQSIIAKTAGSASLSLTTLWLGTPPVSLSSLTETEREYLERKLKEMNCVPVYLDEDEAHRAYHGFCKTILWPVFHNVDQLDQIHAAWNLPNYDKGEGQQKSGLFPTQTQTQQTRSRSNSYTLSFSPAERDACETARDADTAVLEWNKQSLSLQAAYRHVNRVFADAALSLVREGDIAWVHDYHLMLVPSMLRESMRNAVNAASAANGSFCAATDFSSTHATTPRDGLSLKIPSETLDTLHTSTTRDSNNDQNDAQSQSSSPGSGSRSEDDAADAMAPATCQFKIVFFLHIPFPTSQIFRTLPASLSLLESLVCADLVGFHAFDHARHFLNAAKRMLGLRAHTRPGGLLLLSVQDREVLITMSHVSIETDHADEVLSRPHTQALAQSLRERYAGMKVVCGLDVCQRLSGVALKLAGFEKFATDFLSQPERAQGVVLVQRVYRPGSRFDDEETTEQDLRKIVKTLNAKFAHSALALKSASFTPLVRGEFVRNDDGNNSDQSGKTANSVKSDQSGLLESESFSARFEGSSPLNVVGNGGTPVPQSERVAPSDVLHKMYQGGRSDGAVHTQDAQGVSDEDAFRLALSRQGVFIDFQVVSNTDSAASSAWEEECVRFAHCLTADLLLLTPIREGLNALPLEYIYARRALPRAGAVCVSEFSTASSLLNGSLKVNPFSPLCVADAIEKALHMTVRECEYRRQRDLPFILAHPAALWTKQILNELEQVSACVSPSLSLRTRTSALPLNEQALLQAYKDAKTNSGVSVCGSRVFILDYDGALLHRERCEIYMKQTLSAIAGRRPSPHIMRCLRELSEDPHNVVLIITGLSRMKLGSTFRELRNVALATSNGLIYSWGDRLNGSHGHSHHSNAPSHNTLTPQKDRGTTLLPRDKDDREWSLLPQCSETISDWNAVNEIAAPIISRFTFRTNGTCTAPRFPGIGWSFFGADPEWGAKQASQLRLELDAALANFDVKITSLVPGSIEVVPRTLRKGLVVSECLRRVVAMRGGKLPGLVTVFGAEEQGVDDGTTQAVYDALRDAPVVSELHKTHTYNIAVGRERASSAQFYVNNIGCVERVLRAFTECD